ncbi:MAG: hypothetical protein AAF633_20410 [Chloroflexota bacterium]
MLKSHWPFGLLLGVHLLVGALFAINTPAWQAPDEPAHYNYIRQLADGRFPIMNNSDYDQAYISEVIGSRFDPSYDIEPFSYEDYQPPLYYLVQTPIFMVSGGSLIAMRLFGVVMGGITITLYYILLLSLPQIFQLDGRRYRSLPLGPSTRFLPLIFFAFLPQHIALQASVNNDSLTELLIAASLLFLAFQIRAWVSDGRYSVSEDSQVNTGYRSSAASSSPHLRVSPSPYLQILLGLCLLTKVTAYLVVPIAGLAMIWALGWSRPVRLIREGFKLFLLPFLIGTLWWGRNLAVYGWPDFLGIEAHDLAVVGQPTTELWIAQFGASEVLRRFMLTSFQSFWGQFGWMGVLMPSWAYQSLALFSALVFVGFLLTVIRSNRRQKGREMVFGIVASSAAGKSDQSRQKLDGNQGLSIVHRSFLALFLLNLSLYLVYNLTFVQHQGRYLFASLIPISYAVGMGIYFWFQIARLEKLIKPALILFALALIGLNLFSLFRLIVPQLTI